MISLKLLLQNEADFKKRLKTKAFDPQLLDEIINLAKTRSKTRHQLETLQFEKNQLSAEIGRLKRRNGDLSSVVQSVGQRKQEVQKLNQTVTTLNTTLHQKLLYVPNLPNDNVPKGTSEKDNVILAVHDQLGRGVAARQVVPHYEIAQQLALIEFARAVKLSGSRFAIYKGWGAKLMRALENFMLDTHQAKGYIEYIPPLIVKAAMLEGTGNLPKFAADLFKITNQAAYLIPTAEVPLTNLYRNEIIDLTKPRLLMAYSQNFRKEAGSGGRDTKGIMRMHQFNKVELVKIVNQATSRAEFAKTVLDAKEILELLELPYQEVQLCTADLSFSSAETIDLEVWFPAQQCYREVSSISWFGDFQSRRTATRYRDQSGKTIFAHTINGSGLAIDRVLAAILENYQNADGTVTVPQKLVPYLKTKMLGVKNDVTVLKK